jgi:GrpB-like predicted nucleotidyltransferase (UPF0157 family)
MPTESRDDRVRAAVHEEVAVVPYDLRRPERFELEREHLRSRLPSDLVGRIEHLGSTAVPGLAAKPVIDMLVEVASLERTKAQMVPVLTAKGYDYFWRPTFGDDTPPWYAWFIKRDATGARTHHIHMVEAEFPHWERLLFCDFLRGHPDVASEYGELKRRFAAEHPNDRVRYTEGKTAFIASVMIRARTAASALPGSGIDAPTVVVGARP